MSDITSEQVREEATSFVQNGAYFNGTDLQAHADKLFTLADQMDRDAAKLAELQQEIAKHVSPGNENVKRGFFVAALRDVAQASLSNQGNAEQAEARLVAAYEVTGQLQGELGVKGELLSQAKSEVEELKARLAEVEQTLNDAFDALGICGVDAPMSLVEAAQAVRERVSTLSAALEQMQQERDAYKAAQEREFDYRKQDIEQWSQRVSTLSAALERYGDHAAWCRIRRCAQGCCGALEKNGLHHNADNALFHQFVPRECDCGLSAALARAEVPTKPVPQCAKSIGRHGYCTKPAGHSGDCYMDWLMPAARAEDKETR
jgi:DNA repair exonuclease SbcCD ATPase subunit